MKINAFVKKLFFIIVFGGMCTPAQAMSGAWDSAKDVIQKYPVVATLGVLGCIGIGYWQYLSHKKEISLGQYVWDYTYNKNNHPDQKSVPACVEYTDKLIKKLEDNFQGNDFNFDAPDQYDGTALHRVFFSYFDRDNKLTAWLLKKGACLKNFRKSNVLDAQGDLHNLITSMYTWLRYDVTLIQLMHCYDDVKFFAEGAGKSEIATWNSIFNDYKTNSYEIYGKGINAYHQWLVQKETCIALQEEEFVNALHFSCCFKEYIDNFEHIMALAPQETDWSNVLDKPLLHMLCTRNLDTIKKLMPLIARDQNVKHVFLQHCNNFDCLEYQTETKKILLDEQQKLFSNRVIAQKKLVDAQWRFV